MRYRGADLSRGRGRLRSILWIALLAAVIIVIVVSEPLQRRAAVRRHIDTAWFRKSLIEDNLEHWLAAAPTENGFFRPILDRRWRPAETQRATLVSQSRLIYVMTIGYRVTGRREYHDAARRGADFLLEHMRDTEHGGWFWSTSPSGEPLSRRKSTYGHAFVIFGLSHAYRVTADDRYQRAALETWATMKARLRDRHGGFRPGAKPDWSERVGTNSANPIMHLFEALLALYTATGSDEVYADTRELADFVFGRLYNPRRGCLPEVYDEEWNPLPANRGGYIDVGHQFEWAFLLSEAVAFGFPDHYLEPGERLLRFGMRRGYDREHGGIFSAVRQGGRPEAPRKGWWQQCEHLRCLMRYAAEHDRPDLWEPFDKSLQFVREHFIDREYGGWYTSHVADRRPDEDAPKGGVWKAGYHVAGMYFEALRLGGMAAPTAPATAPL
jgi:mannose/cellobiose epimerase-like protein (N-acyl-D-glucosamine 2-epimerase family)